MPRSQRSAYVRSRSHNQRIYIPANKVYTRSSKKRIKRTRVMNIEDKKQREKTQQRHSEYEYEDEIYNCMTGCDVIQILKEECGDGIGLFTALSVKTAICLRDLRFRVVDNMERANNTDTQRMLFIPILRNNLLPDIFSELLNNVVFKSYYKDFLNEFPNHNDEHGIWVSIKRNVEMDESELKTRWIIPLDRVYRCLEYTQQSFKTCSITTEQSEEVHELVDNIIRKNILPSVQWNRLVDTFMGGIDMYTHNEESIRKQLESLHQLHYLSDVPHIKQALQSYIHGLTK